MMKRRWFVGISLLIVVVLAGGFVSILALAHRDVSGQFGRAELTGVRLPATHGVWFGFELHDDRELSHAHWRLIP